VFSADSPPSSSVEQLQGQSIIDHCLSVWLWIEPQLDAVIVCEFPCDSRSGLSRDCTGAVPVRFLFEKEREMRTWISVVSVVIALVTGVGCSGSSDRPPLAYASGTVTFQGKPLADADVSFNPEAGGRSAYGRTDAEGKFELTTFDPRDGASLGKHKVTVKAEVPKGKKDPSNPYQEYESVIPKKYSDAQKTPLQAEVTVGGPPFELKLD
jgi:hypothetical protein